MKNRIFILITIFLILFLPATWDSINPLARLYSMVLFTIGGLTWLFIRVRTDTTLYIPKLIFPLLLYAGLQAILLIVTPLPVYRIYWTLTTLILLLFFLFVVDSIKSYEISRIWINTLIIVAIVFACFDLLSIFTWYAEWWKTSGSIFLQPPFSIRSPGELLGQPNYLAGFINLVIPIALIRLIRSQDKKHRILWFGILMLFLLVAFFTSSRGGWIALAGGVTTVLILIYAPDLKTVIRNRDDSLRNIIFHNKKTWAMALLIVPLLALFPIFMRQVQKASHGTFSDRLAIWNYAIRLISASPIWGHGSGSVPFLYALRSEAIGGDEFFDAHNLWLQISTETGVLGLFIILVMVTLIIRLTISSWERTPTRTPQRDLLIVIIGAGISLALHSLVDYLFVKLYIALTVFLFIGLLYSNASRHEFFVLGKRKAYTIILSLLIIIAMGTIYSLRGTKFFYDGMEYAWDNEWMPARDSICLAADANKDFSYYAFQCSLANGMLAFHNDDQAALEKATDSLNSGLNIDPNWYIHWANLASYEWRNGEYLQAVSHLTKAAEAAPNRSFLWFNLALMEEQLGNRQSAINHYHKAVCQNPWYRESKIFIESFLHDEVLQRDCPNKNKSVTDYSYSELLWSGKQALEVDDITTAKQHFLRAIKIRPHDASGYAYLALANQKSGQFSDAEENLQTAIFVNRTSTTVLLIVAQIYEERGNYDQAIEYMSEAFDLYTKPRVSKRYYTDAYRLMSLPLDISPFLFNGLSLETQGALLHLAEHEHQNGAIERARQIRQWVGYHTHPYGAIDNQSFR